MAPRAQCLFGASILAAVALLACNDEVLSPLVTASEPLGGRGGAAGSAAVGPTIRIALTVENVVDELPLEGVEICVLDHAIDCVTTGADGKTVAEVPADTAIWATLEREGYASTLIGAQTGSEDRELTAPMAARTVVQLVAGSAGASIDESKGQLVFLALGPEDEGGKLTRTEGVTIDLTPAPESGPHYLSDDNFVDPSLDATGASGAALMFNLAPGEAVLSAEHATKTCQGFLAHPLGSGYRVRVLADFITVVSIQCGGDSGGEGGSAGGAGGTAM